MSFISMLIEEIESQERTKVCSVCTGSGSIISFARARFVGKYGDWADDIDSKYSDVKRAWEEAGKPSFAEFEQTCLDIGLGNEEAKDTYELFLTKESRVKCHNCEGGRELTEHGREVAKLKQLITNL
ncbi:TPA: hypothetical protein ACN32G_004580 [Vibrio parahaemolyticus]|nr:hypothetical protein [Vibrio parahaemolyticus]